MKPITRLVALGCAALTVVSAQAENPQPVNQRDNVIITATRTPLSSRRVVAPVDVIDSQTIERSMAVELSELLRFQGGLDVVRTGGPGQQTSIFTRGTNSNHTLVLLDGVRLNTGTFGQAAVQNITPEMIERIEIVKAPRTTLYGPNAIGGVINVITKTSAQPDVNLYAGGGQDRTVKLGAAGGTTIDGFSVNGRVQHADTEGYPIVEGADFDSGWNNTTVEGKASYVTDRWGLQGRLWLSEGTDEYVAFPIVSASQDYDNQVVALAGSVKFTDHWYSVLDLSSTIDAIQQQQSTDFARTELSIADWQNTIDIGEHHVVVAGAYFSNEKVSGIAFGSRLRAEDTDDVAVYLEDAMQYGRHMIVLAGRLSDSDAIDENFTWNIEYGLDVTPGMRLMASAGRAVRAPSAAERFGAFGGNPRLKEEEALTLQAGWGWDFTESQSVTVDLYHTKIDNLIASDANFTLQNIEKAEITGIEAGYALISPSWTLRVRGTLQNPENTTEGSTLLRRSEESATFSLARNIGPHQFGADVRLVGPRRDFGAQKLAGYGLTNLTGRIALGDQWGFYGRIENLFDRDYTTAYYDIDVRYLAPSRGAYVELRFNMN